MMNNKTLTETTNDWHEQVLALQKLLDVVQGELIDAEAGLAEKLAAINAFEFRLRSLTSKLVARLEKLESEIKALRKQLRHLDSDWDEGLEGSWSVEDVEDVAMGHGAQAAGEYRYREGAPEFAPLELDDEAGAELKKLYRQLARRFHPDLGLDEADRMYRTQLMIAINAAYAQHDVDKLRQLALEPDSIQALSSADSDQRLAEALLRELDRCRRRLEEIKVEMRHLKTHNSAKLMQQAEKTTKNGRSWEDEMVAQLQEHISRKLVERDVLEQEVAFHAGSESKVAGDAFADTIWDISLDSVYDDDPDVEAAEYYNRRRERYTYKEDSLDDDDDD